MSGELSHLSYEIPLRQAVPGWLAVVADPIKLHIVSALSEVEEATASDLADSGQASNQTLRRHLEALVTFGIIEMAPGQSDGETPGRPAARFTLPAATRESVQSILTSA
jgi:predicted ArsR family transcriptional regulator